MTPVPEWAVPAVAAGWTFIPCPDYPEYDTVRRFVVGHGFAIVYPDGGGAGWSAVGPEDMHCEPIPRGSVPDSLKLADEYAESVGGWA